ncbi:hypothetical protein NTD86_16795 [Pseudomonas sp. 7P_10.2_Bac1]|uniref:hypothetical protein n=1 Tax=Pseudomonas sp. 7P_10.2_Bac1 TaxID=2971614 RepID=UPI0021C9E810|nr:hypothetical protein [Pseudomonas sp. 7P_10.2_Bac1]MCU1728642.1 hypothetical protein [Pseudomonas sp. 7P_10.2_Bac1]
MSLPEMPNNTSRREMRKMLIRLRMEMHRQEIRHESQQLLEPLHKMRGVTTNWKEHLGIRHAPLWGVAVVSVLGFLTGKGTKSKGVGGVSRLVGLATGLLPLIKMVIQGSARKP